MDWLLKVLNVFSDIIAPPKIEVAEIEAMSAEDFSRRAGHLRIGREISRTIIPFEYESRIVRAAIWEIKFRGSKKIAFLVAQTLYDALLEEIAEMRLFDGNTLPILAVIPITAKTRRERGWNQCEIIADALADIDGGKNFTLQKDILIKIRETKDSVGLSKKDRAENLRECFAVKNPSSVKNKCIIVLDDVVTTGATLTEARRALASAGARKVIGLAIAH